MNLWKTTIFSLIYFFIIEIIAGLAGLAIYYYHHAQGSEVCNAITLMVLCEGIAIWAAILAQKYYFRKILKRNDWQLEGDIRLVMMDKMAGNYFIVLIVLFVVFDCWLNISQRLNCSPWIFLVINIIVVVSFCHQKVKWIDDEREVIEFSEAPFVIQRLFLAASPWLAAIAGASILAK